MKVREFKITAAAADDDDVDDVDDVDDDDVAVAAADDELMFRTMKDADDEWLDTD